MSNKNELLARRIINEIFSQKNLNSFYELISEDITIHDTDKEIHGLENLKVGINNLHIAFPDLNYDIEDILLDGDKVVARCKGSGTHLGTFRGISATDKKMNYTVILIWRFSDGKLIEHWSVSDVYGMLQQLEVINIKVK
ncbi:ester cyclase [Segetibacter koreensis]|uniref:ester cyclase n=1 Tax=Segetibacter koreensis TaxID=398037 RepID=UPI00035F2FB6|nr:ester cyclase [Segetibacter koreensis]